MSKILKRTSFGLLRTNPKLTTNIKIIADSKNHVYLESIDADPLLSKSIYKGFNVTGGSYAFDLRRFYSQGTTLPKSIAYTVFEEDLSTNVQSDYHNQYDFTYGMGMQPKNSRLYTEEFSMFFPLWVERDSIPDYFLIFKLDGPVTFNTNTPNFSGSNLDTDPMLNSLITDPSYFFENYISKAKIIKTFDLTYKSAIGSYIRRHVENPLFPESSIYVAFDKNELSYWQGISYDQGGFTKKAKNIYTDYVLVDKTLTESDDFITYGFTDNGIVHPNILNLEFLFDDPDQDKYTFSRYFGLYVSEAELGKFILDGNRLFIDKDNEYTQTPRPTKNDYGYPELVTSQIQNNENGIKVYPHVSPTGPTGLTGPYSGRLINFNETQNPRFPYIKDVKGNFYSIDSQKGWTSIFYLPATGPTANPTPYIDSNYLRIKNTYVDWSNFTGFEKPFNYIDCKVSEKKGKASFSFRITGTVSTGDEIRIKYTDWNNPNQLPYIDNYTVRGSSSLSPRTNSGLLFSTNGTKMDIAISIANSINQIESFSGEYQVFRAIAIGDEVIVYILTESENWNKIKYTLYSSSISFPFSFPSNYPSVQVGSYLPSPVSTSTLIMGSNFFEYTFLGANNNPKSRILVERDKVLEFYDSIENIYVKTDKGYSTCKQYSLYLDKPIKDVSGNIVGFEDFSKYYVIELSDTLQSFDVNSSNKVGLYKTAKNSNGYLTIFPIRDFDFDFNDRSYAKDADSDFEKLYSWYKGDIIGPNGELPIFNWNLLDATEKNYVTSILGPTSSFAIGGGFQKLNGMINDYDDTNEKVINEYDRLKENLLPDLALSSKVVPFINKWVYDNESVDVRENNYRLNTDQAFGYSNFSPSFDEFSKNSKFFTHEWYYLQKYPPYMSYDEKVNSFSYFENDLNFPTIPLPGTTGSTATYAALVSATGASANLLSINEDYFLSYFTRESVEGQPVPREFRYSIFSYGDQIRFSETLFRGAKIVIKDRSEFSPINYNIESLKFLSNPKYNGYRFSAVLTYGNAGTQFSVIKNDVWKSITLVAQADIADKSLCKYTDFLGATHSFIDRAHLYTLQNSLSSPNSSTIEISDKTISGSVLTFDNNSGENWFTVVGGPDPNGNFPNFFEDLTFNENGGYNSVYSGSTASGNYMLIYNGIYDVTATSFKCTSIDTNMPTGGPTLTTLLPGTGNSYAQYKNIIWGPLYSFAWTAWDATLNGILSYDLGGYNAYQSILEGISFATLANHINSGDPEIKYISVDSSGNVEFNKFCIELVRPDNPVKSTYLKSIPLKQKPVDLQTAVRILGYEITNEERMSINQITRYRGGYNPKWRDIFKFVDTTDLKNDGLEYNNAQILTSLPNIQDSSIGMIKNLYFNKVNVENPNVILRSAISNESKNIFPLIGEYAIDYADYFTFRSNWDPFYFRKYIKPDVFENVIGTREPKEEKAFFSSKVISIPGQITLETFPQGIIPLKSIGTIRQISTVNENIASQEIEDSKGKVLILDVATNQALADYLISDGFSSEFYKYINPNYSFGDPILDDDIKNYIYRNIVDRYVVKNIIFWEKFWNKGNPSPQVETNLTDSQKIANGYVVSRNFTTKFVNPDDLNFQLIYNIPLDKNFSIAFTVVLEKK